MSKCVIVRVDVSKEAENEIEKMETDCLVNSQIVGGIKNDRVYAEDFVTFKVCIPKDYEDEFKSNLDNNYKHAEIINTSVWDY